MRFLLNIFCLFSSEILAKWSGGKAPTKSGALMIEMWNLLTSWSGHHSVASESVSLETFGFTPFWSVCISEVVLFLAMNDVQIEQAYDTLLTYLTVSSKSQITKKSTLYFKMTKDWYSFFWSSRNTHICILWSPNKVTYIA